MSITVNIMSYKYGHLVSQAVESVLSQTLKPDVIRVYDDGIGDCDVSKYPVELIKRETNLGIIDNFNDALLRTETDKVLFLGADNWLRPDALEEMNNANVDICGSYVNLFGTEVDEFRVGLPTEYKDGYFVWKPNALHGSSLYNVSLAKNFGYKRNPHSVKSEEDSMLFNQMKQAGATTTIVEEPLLYYRRHKQNFQ